MLQADAVFDWNICASVKCFIFAEQKDEGKSIEMTREILWAFGAVRTSGLPLGLQHHPLRNNPKPHCRSLLPMRHLTRRNNP
jgi:hypothetical protein